MSEKDAAEIDAFTRFVTIAELPIDLGSIKHGEHREPDIICHHRSDGPLAFELVELIDENFASGMSRCNAEELFYSAYDTLPSLEHAKFDEIFGDADIHFEFKDSPTMKAVKRSSSLILTKLLDMDSSFQGVYEPKESPLSDLIKRITVTRGISGPCFSIPSYIRMGDPTIPALRKKFGKNYQSNGPIELLAYIKRNIMFPETIWKPIVQEFFSKKPGCGQFRRVWIVDLTKKRIEFDYHVV